MSNPKNKIFSANEVAVISEAVKQSTEVVEAKVKTLSGLMIGVVIVTFIGFITMIIMVATLLIDSFNIKSTSCKDYSQNIETFKELIKPSVKETNQ